MSSENILIIDDRSSNTLLANNGMYWRVISDTVMGGVSSGSVFPAEIEGRHCLRLIGHVRLENSGGFVQASLDLCNSGVLDASGYSGIQIEVLGNGEIYNLHLRTEDTRIVWQSFRANFQAHAFWQRLQIPFEYFKPHRLEAQLDTRKLRKLGIVAIGREMHTDVCIASVALFR